MKCLQIQGINQVSVVDLPPEPIGEDMIRVAVRHVGLCGTDFALTEGTLGLNVWPVIPGHEVIGTVVESHSARFGVGDRVVLDPLISCGICHACRIGRPQWCEHVGVIGVVQDGGLREEMVLSDRQWVPWPRELPLNAGVLTEPLHVIETIFDLLGPERPPRILVIGTGALGLMLLHVLAHYWPATDLCVYDVVEDRLNRAVAIGANPWHPHSNESVDVVIDGVGTDESFEMAASSVANGGHLVVYGVPKPGCRIPRADWLFRKNVRVSFSRLYTHEFRHSAQWLADGVVPAVGIVSDNLSLEEAAVFLREQRWKSPARWGKAVVTLNPDVHERQGGAL